MVDTFTKWHLRVLVFLRAPSAQLESQSTPPRQPESRADLVCAAFSRLGKTPAFEEQAILDLENNGLIEGGLGSGVVAHTSQLAQPCVTDFGRQFLAFTSEPIAGKGQQ